MSQIAYHDVERRKQVDIKETIKKIKEGDLEVRNKWYYCPSKNCPAHMGIVLKKNGSLHFRAKPGFLHEDCSFGSRHVCAFKVDQYDCKSFPINDFLGGLDKPVEKRKGGKGTGAGKSHTSKKLPAKLRDVYLACKNLPTYYWFQGRSVLNTIIDSRTLEYHFGEKHGFHSNSTYIGELCFSRYIEDSGENQIITSVLGDQNFKVKVILSFADDELFRTIKKKLFSGGYKAYQKKVIVAAGKWVSSSESLEYVIQIKDKRQVHIYKR